MWGRGRTVGSSLAALWCGSRALGKWWEDDTPWQYLLLATLQSTRLLAVHERVGTGRAHTYLHWIIVKEEGTLRRQCLGVASC